MRLYKIILILILFPSCAFSMDSGTINDKGNLYVGGSEAIGTTTIQTPFYVLKNTGTVNDNVDIGDFESNHFTQLYVDSYTNGDAGYVGPLIILRRAEGTHASPTGVLTNDAIGRWSWRGWNGSVWCEAGLVRTSVGTITSGGVPGEFSIWTGPDGATCQNVVQRFLIDDTGVVTTAHQTNNGACASVGPVGQCWTSTGQEGYCSGIGNVCTTCTAC